MTEQERLRLLREDMENLDMEELEAAESIYDRIIAENTTITGEDDVRNAGL